MNISIKNLSEEKAKKVLKENRIPLSSSEFNEIEENLGRPLTKVEAAIFGIQGSEHSSYKSSRKFLSILPTEGENVILGPQEDAGIVKIFEHNGEEYGIVMGHESHNHPSQIVPYEGAATGIGGIVRDICCMGAKVVGVLDSLRFGDAEKNHTKSIFSGVVEGIAGYGNPIGVPNLGGDLFFDKAYDGNCLVNVACIGAIRKSDLIHSSVPKFAKDEKYDLIIVGKPTDFSGFGGASFASSKLSKEEKEKNKGAVQEPNPFLKRHLLVSTYDLFRILKEENLLDRVGFKDCGAGGMMCASVELVESAGFGAEINLDEVPLGEKDVSPEVIACAETQERFVWAVPENLTQKVISHYNEKWNLPDIAENARAKKIGEVKNHGKYILFFEGEKVCNADANFITKGLYYERDFEIKENKGKEPEIKEEGEFIFV